MSRVLGEADPFSLFIMIANDMLGSSRASRSIGHIRRGRDALRARLRERAFADYLDEDEAGQISLRRLPAEDDPM